VEFFFFQKEMGKSSTFTSITDILSVADVSRRTVPEPKWLLWLRIATSAFVVAVFLTYFGFIVATVVNDAPVIRMRYETMDRILVPDIEICSESSDVRLTYCNVTWLDEKKKYTLYDNCIDDFGRTFLPLHNFSNPNEFCYLFTTNKTLIFFNKLAGEVPGGAVQRIDFGYKVLDLKKAISQTLAIPALALQVFDPDYNPLWFPKTQNRKLARDVESDMRLQRNNFVAMQNYVTMARFRKVTYREISPGDFGSIFDFMPSYYDATVLETTTQIFPMHPNPNFTPKTNTGHFSIQLETFRHDIQEQHRTRTILSSLGLIGGAFGLICLIYTLLFGGRRIRPWGFVHSMSLRKRLRNANKQFPETIPLVSPLPTPKGGKEAIFERTTILEQRVLDLERLLRDHYLDARHLNDLHQCREQNAIEP
jgi:hypothetical protein